MLTERRNLVLVAPQSLGKTMIAQNIAHQAVVEGHTALFTTASQLLLDLGAQDSPRALDRRLKHYARASLLVVDEVGYLSCDARNADLLFQGSGEETQNVCAGCGELLPGAREPRRRWAPQVPLESPSGRRARVPGSARGEREGAQSRGRWPGA